MKKTFLLTGIGVILLLGVLSLNGITNARADDEDETSSGGVVSLPYNITSADNVNSAVIGPVTPAIFTMIFKTTADYDGKAVFQAQKDDGTWITIGPPQIAGKTTVDGADSIFPASLKVPLVMQVNVTKQATMGQSLAELDYVGSPQNNCDDGDKDDHDKDHIDKDCNKKDDKKPKP